MCLHILQLLNYDVHCCYVPLCVCYVTLRSSGI